MPRFTNDRPSLIRIAVWWVHEITDAVSKSKFYANMVEYSDFVEAFNTFICNALFDGHFMSMQGVLKRNCNSQ